MPSRLPDISSVWSVTRLFDAPSLLLWQMGAMTSLFLPLMAWEQAPAQAFAPSAALLTGLAVTGCLRRARLPCRWALHDPCPASRADFASEPAYAAWLSWYFLGETLDVQGWIGSALILIAVLIGALVSPSPGPVAGTTEPA